MKNKAFTMAEMLIVMVIIAFLASFTISALSQATPDKNMMMFKKAYQTVERVAGELVNDEEMYPYDRNRLGFRNTDAVNWPGANDIYGGDNNNANVKATRATKFCKLFERKLNVIANSGATRDNCGWFDAADGISYRIERNDMSGTNAEFTVFVDVNGREESQGPNCINRRGTSAINECPDNDARDVFRVLVNFDGKVRVEDPLAIEYLRTQDTNRNAAQTETEAE